MAEPLFSDDEKTIIRDQIYAVFRDVTPELIDKSVAVAMGKIKQEMPAILRQTCGACETTKAVREVAQKLDGYENQARGAGWALKLVYALAVVGGGGALGRAIWYVASAVK